LKEVRIKVPDVFFASELLGVNIHEILDLMGQYGIPAVDYSADDLEKELEIMEKISAGGE